MEQRTLSVRDGMFEVDVREYGDANAEPLLFLHGSNSLLEGAYLDGLGERFRVIAPYHPGWGESTGLEHIDDMVDFALFYYDFMDAIGVKSAHVAGHSLGGMLAAEVAAIDPHRVRKLVLNNAVGFWRDDDPVLDFFSEDPGKTMQAVWFDAESDIAKAGRPDMTDMPKLAEFMYQNVQSLAAAAKFLWPIPDRGLKKRIHRITAPTLVIWGERDRLVSKGYAEEFRSRIAHARVEIFEQSAHFPMLEQPDEWTASVTKFLMD